VFSTDVFTDFGLCFRRVGRIVAEAATRDLTPCTLELGGQTAVVIDEAINLELAARRIIYGKAQNAG
jgi:aldehyde dehydrogenase (NAD+)